MFNFEARLLETCLSCSITKSFPLYFVKNWKGFQLKKNIYNNNYGKRNLLFRNQKYIKSNFIKGLDKIENMCFHALYLRPFVHMATKHHYLSILATTVIHLCIGFTDTCCVHSGNLSAKLILHDQHVEAVAIHWCCKYGVNVNINAKYFVTMRVLNIGNNDCWRRGFQLRSERTVLVKQFASCVHYMSFGYLRSLIDEGKDM